MKPLGSIMRMVAMACCVTACSTVESAAQTTSAPAPQERILMHGGLERRFLIAGGDRAHAAPLVMVLHGGGTADGARTLGWGFVELGARDGVVTVHPSGQGEGWNDARVSSYLTERQGGEIDDVGFLLAIIDQLGREGLIDPARVYLTGASNGGMMAYRMACEAGDRFVAIAPYIAHFPVGAEQACEAAPQVPMLIVVGDEDRLMPYEGGPVAPVGPPRDRGLVISADATFAWWRDHNGCDGAQVAYLADAAPSDGTRLRQEVGVDCAVETSRLVVEGGGHRLPSIHPDTVESSQIGRIAGRTSHDIDGPAYIWDFFARHGLQERSAP